MTCVKNKSALCIVFSLQAICGVLCNNSRENAKIDLKSIFGRSFKTIPKTGEKYVWKISADNETFEPEDYSKGFRTFKSTETYLIFEKKWFYDVNVFYWVGNETSLEQKKTVAKYAIMFHHLFFQIWIVGVMRINLIRECETFESETFQYTLHQLKGTVPPRGIYSPYRDDHFPLNGPNLYIVKGDKTTSRAKKVTFSLRWIKPNICLMIQPGPFINELHPATIWCGQETNTKVRRRATEFVREFSVSSDVDVITGLGTKYKILIELLEDDGNNRPFDVDTSSDDKINENEFVNIRDESLKLFELSDEYNGGKEEKNIVPFDSTTLYFHTLVKKNVLFDSNSIAGLYFISDPKIDDINAKIWALQYAEDYVNSQIKVSGRPILMRIMSTFPINLFHFDFMINVRNLPVNYLHNDDTELW